jgi:tetratricopeptide (TPR) repeat protein
MIKENPQKKSIFKIRPNFQVCLFLVIVTLCVYLQVRNYEFVFDDDLYIAENLHIRNGFTIEAIAWAFNFSDKYDSYWHPITWLSHMLDYQLYGLNSGMHHRSNLIFHIANSFLLFLVFKRMTGALWKSAFVAALFALHPLNVESVAWAAERKNVLSTFFWMLTILSYSYYAKQPVFYRYLLTFFAFALGLMAKPMLVTLPFVMFLLDYWPLERFHFGHFGWPSNRENEKYIIFGSQGLTVFRLVLEKVPFLVLSVFSIYLSSSSLQGVVISIEAVPMQLRIANALVSYVKYIGKIIWPQNLAFFYPYPKILPTWQIIGASMILVCIFVPVIFAGKRKPYLMTGWLWYMGTLMPVIGLMQAGLWPAMADRWAYVPIIGLFVMIAWGIPEFFEKRSYKKRGLVIIAAATLSILSVVTWLQVRYWANSISLNEHALEVTDDNYVAHNNLGVALLEKKSRTFEAMVHFKKALQIKTDYADAHNNLGISIAGFGRTEDAIRHYSEALKIAPGFKEARYNLGGALFKEGRLNEAISNYLEVLELCPNYAEAHNNLGVALSKQGRIAEAMTHFKKALWIKPDYIDARNNMQTISATQKKIDDTIAKIKEKIKVNQEDSWLHFKLGNLYKKKGELDKAIYWYQKALSMQPDYVPAINSMAILYAIRGEYNKALSLFKKSIVFQPDSADAYYFIAGIHAKRKMVEESIDWLSKGIEKGFNNWDLLKTDKNFDNIRDSSYFKVLITDNKN